MKVELVHDVLAKAIYQRSSIDDKRILKIERLIQDSYLRYVERDVLMSKDDLTYIAPFLSQVIIPTEQRDFIELSKKELKEQARQRRKRNLMIAFAMGILTIIALGTIFYATSKITDLVAQSSQTEEQLKRTEQAKNEAEKQLKRAVSLQKDAELLKNKALQDKERIEQDAQIAIQNVAKAKQKLTEANEQLKKANQAIETAKTEAKQAKVNAEKEVKRAKTIKANAEKQLKEANEKASGIIQQAEKARSEKQKLVNIAQVSFLSNQAIRLLRAGEFKAAKDLTLKARNLWADTLKLGYLQNADNFNALHLCLKHQEGENYRTYQPKYNPRSFRAISISSTNKLVIGDEAGIIRLFKNTNQSIHKLSETFQTIQLNKRASDIDEIYALQFVKDHLLVGTLEGRFMVLNIAQLKDQHCEVNTKYKDKDPVLIYFKNYTHPIKSISVSDDGEKIAFFTSQSDSLHVLYTNGTVYKERTSKHIPNIRSISWHKENQLWIGTNKGIQLFDFRKNTLTTPDNKLIPETSISSIAQKGNTLAIGALDGRIWIIQIKKDKLIKLLNADFIKSHNSTISDLKFNYNASKLISSSHDGTAKIWNLKQLANHNDARIVLNGHESWIFGAGFSLNNRYIYTISEDKTLRQWLSKEEFISEILEE